MAVVTWYVIVFHIVIYAIIQPLGNLSQTGLHEYKNGRQSAEVAFASSFPQLITPLIFLNIATDHISDFLQHPNLEELLSPTDEKRNQKKIYRVGTFLRYFISDNQTRVFDDYLLERYKKFIFDPDPKIVHERLRELNVDYVLIDPNLGTLNTANIPELQKRYEDTLVSLR